MKTFKQLMDEIDVINLDERCWPGYKSTPGKKAYSKGSCVKEDTLDEKIISVKNATGNVIKVASQFKDTYKKHGYNPVPGTRLEQAENIDENLDIPGSEKMSNSERHSAIMKKYPKAKQVGKTPGGYSSQGGSKADLVSGFRGVRKIKEDVEELDEVSKSTVKSYLSKTVDPVHGIPKSKEKLSQRIKGIQRAHERVVGNKPTSESVELDEVAAWQRKEGKNPEGGLNQKGVESYRRENPGSKLQTAVTTKPSKLKPGSKAANRRKSFCARMGGMKKRLTSAKTANDPDSRINKALRKWNC